MYKIISTIGKVVVEFTGGFAIAQGTTGDIIFGIFIIVCLIGFSAYESFVFYANPKPNLSYSRRQQLRRWGR